MIGKTPVTSFEVGETIDHRIVLALCSVNISLKGCSGSLVFCEVNIDMYTVS